ncbi:MAG TPA: radical SAM protein [Thermoanaerobaculia bacterium]|nr:radical SAM protein [Thermoanaerobaculia bacterium]HQR67101.1 radical SAM protein [Thermoanaerobaculia bacterium]
MKIDIVVVYVPRYRCGHEMNFVPPLTGLHLAALTPARHRVRVIHQQVEAVDVESDADLVALSFFSGFAPEAYRLAGEFRRRGKRVVGGGPHVTFSPAEALRFLDAVVLGEADALWPRLLDDAEAGRLARVYEGPPPALDGLPTPRYDLLRGGFFVPRVVQATRGCPYACSFCTVPALNPGVRTRPVADVIRDVTYDRFPHWWQRKVVWFWDDNLTVRRPYVERLLREMVPLKRWWLTQASLDVARDPALLDLMKASGCIGVFFGLESFGEASLRDARKRQNRVEEYRASVAALHARGICVMAGLIAGLDGDTPASIRAMAARLDEVGVDVPFLSILTPFPGTSAWDALAAEGRLRRDAGWEHFNGYNVAFRPKTMSGAELLDAHRDLWREAFSPANAARRVLRAARTLRAGAFLMCAAMNGFYGLKGLTGNEPRSFEDDPAYAEIGRRIRDAREAGPERPGEAPPQRLLSFATTASTS